jgi:cytochrome b561
MQMDEGKPYTSTAKALHWFVFVLLVVQYTIAWTMPDIGPTTPLTTLHFSVGALIFLAVAVRLIWRMSHAEPKFDGGVPRWQVASARIVHWLLYLVLLVLPILGWINASWRDMPVSFFGLFTLPKIVATRAAGWGWTGDVHSLLATYGLLGLVALHVVAAIYHFFGLRDRVLQRMLPNIGTCARRELGPKA